MIYLYISTALFIGSIIIVYWIHSQYHLDIVVKPTPPPAQAPLISVCVPARNEERNIRACVESILSQDYPSFEVIVVDDRSTDGTAQVLRTLLMESGSSSHSQGVLSQRAQMQEQAPALQIIH